MIRRRALLLGTLAATGCEASGGAAAGGTPAASGSAPAAPADLPAGNAVRLRDASGSGASNYPLRLGRPFVAGEIAGAPQAVIGGMPVPTQADIKTRWPDGSVQHAILSFVVPHIPVSGSVTVAFANQPAVAATPTDRAALLDPALDFDAVMELTRDGKTQSASARTMLQNGDAVAWCQGAIAPTFVLADHSAARRYDIGPSARRPVRPIFHVTFWPALHKVHVRAIAENSNTETLEDIVYDVTLTAGLAKPDAVFRQEAVAHYAATRWTRSFWIGGAPESRIDIDHNLAYLARTKAFPNYDTSLRVPETALARDYTMWTARPKGLYGEGLWTKYMPSTGGRDDLGHQPAWVTRWLYTGDHRMFEITSGQAELAAAWPVHVREGNQAKRFDAAHQVPAIGRVLSVYARPSLWIFDARFTPRPEDAVPIEGPRIMSARGMSAGEWVDDGAHQADAFSALYVLTGDYYAFEQMQIWAGTYACKYDPSFKSTPPYGVHGSGVIWDQVRGNGWVLRNRVNAAYWSPDGTPEKAYFTTLIDDAIAFWEGAVGIEGTRFTHTRTWSDGDSIRGYHSPLHVFSEHGIGGGDPVDTTKAKMCYSPWMQNFFTFELAVAREKGYPTGPLLSYLAVALTGQFKDPEAYPFANVARYRIPTRRIDGTLIASWPEALAAVTEKTRDMRVWTLQNFNVGDGYPAYAYATTAMLTNEPGGAFAYGWMRDNAYTPFRSLYAQNPKWAILPRS
jgi:hypothetical protein